MEISNSPIHFQSNPYITVNNNSKVSDVNPVEETSKSNDSGNSQTSFFDSSDTPTDGADFAEAMLVSQNNQSMANLSTNDMLSLLTDFGGTETEDKGTKYYEVDMDVIPQNNQQESDSISASTTDIINSAKEQNAINAYTQNATINEADFAEGDGFII